MQTEITASKSASASRDVINNEAAAIAADYLAGGISLAEARAAIGWKMLELGHARWAFTKLNSERGAARRISDRSGDAMVICAEDELLDFCRNGGKADASGPGSLDMTAIANGNIQIGVISWSRSKSTIRREIVRMNEDSKRGYREHASLDSFPVAVAQIEAAELVEETKTSVVGDDIIRSAQCILSGGRPETKASAITRMLHDTLQMDPFRAPMTLLNSAAGDILRDLHQGPCDPSNALMNATGLESLRMIRLRLLEEEEGMTGNARSRVTPAQAALLALWDAADIDVLQQIESPAVAFILGQDAVKNRCALAVPIVTQISGLLVDRLATLVGGGQRNTQLRAAVKIVIDQWVKSRSELPNEFRPAATPTAQPQIAAEMVSLNRMVRALYLAFPPQGSGELSEGVIARAVSDLIEFIDEAAHLVQWKADLEKGNHEAVIKFEAECVDRRDRKSASNRAGERRKQVSGTNASVGTAA